MLQEQFFKSEYISRDRVIHRFKKCCILNHIGRWCALLGDSKSGSSLKMTRVSKM